MERICKPIIGRSTPVSLGRGNVASQRWNLVSRNIDALLYINSKTATTVDSYNYSSKYSYRSIDYSVTIVHLFTWYWTCGKAKTCNQGGCAHNTSEC
jgi:hypothetical protein